MINRGNKYKFYLVLVFSFFGIFPFIDVFLSDLFHTSNLVKYLTFGVYIAAFGLLFYILKEFDKKSDEYHKNQVKLQNIFDTLDVAIWSHELKSKKLLITPGIEKLYGYKLESFYEDNMLWKKVIFPEDLHILEDREQKLSEGKTVTSQYRIIRPGGEVRWILDRGIPTIDEKGDLVDFNSVLFDITDRKESEDLYH